MSSRPLGGLALGLACQLLLVACGETDAPTETILGLAERYDATGVVRVLPDGTSAKSMRVFSFSLTEIRGSGGSALGKLTNPIGTNVSWTGTFAGATGLLSVSAFEAAVTSTAIESVTAFGARGEDIVPSDGIADELTGYFGSRIGPASTEGSFLAAAEGNRPAPPQMDLVRTNEIQTGRIIVEGRAGAVGPRLAVEVFRYSLGRPDPDVVLGQATEAGSFAVELMASFDDVFLIRSRAAGRASIALRIGP